MRWDIAIAGGGPAGLAAAIEAARRGLSTIVFERRTENFDKACGEGVMPGGVRALDRLGVLGRIDPTQQTRLEGIRFVQENGDAALGRFHGGFGLGIRRLALRSALYETAQASGATIVQGRSVRHCRHVEGGVRVTVDDEEHSARLLVVADGLHSPLRRSLGLDGPHEGTRVGLRAHFLGVETTFHVEVHWADRVEAFLTPVGPRRLGVAFLFDGPAHHPVSFDALLQRFPLIANRVRSASFDSEPRGAGPLAHRARAVVQGRIVLLGDAAGYVDAITGEGLTLAFASAAALGRLLPSALTDPADLADYAGTHARLFAAFQLTAGTLVGLARRPRLRRPILTALSHAPGVFDQFLRLLD